MYIHLPIRPKSPFGYDLVRIRDRLSRWTTVSEWSGSSRAPFTLGQKASAAQIAKGGACHLRKRFELGHLWATLSATVVEPAVLLIWPYKRPGIVAEP